MIRIQKFLANQGLMSRRAADQAIRDSRVKINDQKAIPGQVVEPGDQVFLDGKHIIPRKVIPQLMLYNKPVGRICSMAEDEMHRSIWQDFPKLGAGKWISVGRLDINTSGLLLFTNYGELANRLMHPSYEIKREYLARIHGDVDQKMLNNLTDGVVLEDGLAKFQTVKAQHHRNPEERTSSNQWFRCILAEGKTREVRRLWESQDVEVSRLKRISYGPIELPSFIRRSEFIELEPKQVGSLFKAVNLKSPKFNESNQLRDIRQRKEKRLRARGNPWKK